MTLYGALVPPVLMYGSERQRRQSGLKTGGSWIRVKKISIFSGNLTKIIDFSGQISEKFRFFLGNFTKNFDFTMQISEEF